MARLDDLFVGIDVGTGGVRLCAVTAEGDRPASAARPFPDATVTGLPAGRHEQRPADWWAAVVDAFDDLAQQLRNDGRSTEAVVGLCVTSTSATVVPVDAAGRALHNAIMYNDNRATRQADEINRTLPGLCRTLGYRFNASFALPKCLWLAAHDAERVARCAYLEHAADYLAGQLTGVHGVSDPSNARKTGYDVGAGARPDEVRGLLGDHASKLPRVVPTGSPLSQVRSEWRRRWGLRPDVTVFAGATDGVTSQFASGACVPGHWTSVIGTTLVLKGITGTPIADPASGLYCHRHPDGFWLPGGASNVGAELLAREFPDADYASMDAAVASRPCTDLVVYPLARRGERFPFVCAEAEPFWSAPPQSRLDAYAAILEGVAVVERWCFGRVAELLTDPVDHVFIAGATARSRTWTRLRASAVERPMKTARFADSAFGAALVAASGATGRSLSDVCRDMVQIECCTDPEPALSAVLADKETRLKSLCAERGYWTPEPGRPALA